MADRLYTPKCVISYPFVFTSRFNEDSGKHEFSATFIFDKAAQATKEYAALKAAVKPTAEAKWGAKLPANLKNPFLTGVAGVPEDCVIIRCKSQQPPGVVDAKVQKIIDPTEIYPGAIVIATVNCFAWENKKGGKGVSFGLGNIQKIGDGPRIDNRKTADQDFQPVDAGEGGGAAAGGGNVDDIFK